MIAIYEFNLVYRLTMPSCKILKEESNLYYVLIYIHNLLVTGSLVRYFLAYCWFVQYKHKYMTGCILLKV